MNITEISIQIDVRTKQAVKELFATGVVKIVIEDYTNREGYRGNQLAVKVIIDGEVMSTSIAPFGAVYN
jgi:hypothetical protein